MITARNTNLASVHWAGVPALPILTATSLQRRRELHCAGRVAHGSFVAAALAMAGARDRQPPVDSGERTLHAQGGQSHSWPMRWWSRTLPVVLAVRCVTDCAIGGDLVARRTLLNPLAP